MSKSLSTDKGGTLQQVRIALSTRMTDIKAALPAHVDASRFARLFITALVSQPKLQECSTQSLIKCVFEAASLGLELDGVQGMAYAVPFWNKNEKRLDAQFMPGYQGLLELAYRTERVAFIGSEVVYSNDKFSRTLGTSPKIEHEEAEGNRGEVVGVYAFATLIGPTGQVLQGVNPSAYMSIGEVHSVRERSKAQDFGPWKTDYLAMVKKTAAKQLCKWLPKSPQLSRAVSIVDREESGMAPAVVAEVDGPQLGSSAPVEAATGEDARASYDRLQRQVDVQGSTGEAIDAEVVSSVLMPDSQSDQCDTISPDQVRGLEEACRIDGERPQLTAIRWGKFLRMVTGSEEFMVDALENLKDSDLPKATKMIKDLKANEA